MENKFYFFAVGAAYGGQRCNNNYSKFLCQQVGRDGSANQLQGLMFVYVREHVHEPCSFVFVCVRSPNFVLAGCVRELAMFANSSRTFVRENCEACDKLLTVLVHT